MLGTLNTVAGILFGAVALTRPLYLFLPVVLVIATGVLAQVRPFLRVSASLGAKRIAAFDRSR
jgi:hypothetical protein